MKLCTCFSALVSSDFLATTATTSAVQPAPYSRSALIKTVWCDDQTDGCLSITYILNPSETEPVWKHFLANSSFSPWFLSADKLPSRSRCEGPCHHSRWTRRLWRSATLPQGTYWSPPVHCCTCTVATNTRFVYSRISRISRIIHFWSE